MSPCYHGMFFCTLCLIVLACKCAAKNCSVWERVTVVQGELQSNGSLWDPGQRILYPPGSHWRKEVNGSSVLYGCPCNLGKPCLRKCCQIGEAMDFDSLECVPYDASVARTNGRSVKYPSRNWFRPNVTSDPTGLVTEVDSDHFALIIGNYCHGYLLEPKYYPETDEFFLNFTDGTLSMVSKNKSGLGPSEFCLEYLPAVNEYLPYVCFNKLLSTTGMCYNVRFILYPIAFSVSIVFLIISLCVYILIPELRNMHGKCLMCHMSSSLLAYICLAAVQGAGLYFSDGPCTAIGFVIYFAMMSSFFWLNIMCVDLYLTFSNIKPLRGNAQERDRKKFLWYVLYAWGLPFIILLVALFMEFFPDLPAWVLRPGFKKTCWFQDGSKTVYFVIPIGIITSCNTLLFLGTAFNIFKVSQSTRVLKQGDSQRHNRQEDKNRLKLYVKLAVVMGVSWGMEVISNAGGSECNWIFTDLMNILQGVFIFLIFVCKKKVKDQLVARFFPSKVKSDRPLAASATSSGRSTVTTNVSSQGIK